MVQSELRVTTHDAPNSPSDIASVKIPAIRIEPQSSGSFMKKNLLHAPMPSVRAHSSYSGLIERSAGNIIRTTKGVVIMMCAKTGVAQNE